MSIVKTSMPDSLLRANPNREAAPIVGVSIASKVDKKGTVTSDQAFLRSQGVNAAWFLAGIHESNGALFHASLYPILPTLRLRVESFLKTHPEVSLAWGPFTVTHLIEEIIAIAFEQRDSWTSKTMLADWLEGFIEMASTRLAQDDE